MLKPFILAMTSFSPALIHGVVGVTEASTENSFFTHGLLLVVVGICVATFTAVLKHISNTGVHLPSGTELVIKATCDATKEGFIQQQGVTREMVKERIDSVEKSIDIQMEGLNIQISTLHTIVNNVLELVKDLHKEERS